MVVKKRSKLISTTRLSWYLNEADKNNAVHINVRLERNNYEIRHYDLSTKFATGLI